MKTVIQLVREQLTQTERDVGLRYAQILYASMPRKLTDYLSPPELASFVLQRFSVISKGAPDGLAVLVANAPVGDAHLAYNASTIETLTSDRPFILDSIREYFRREGLSVYLVLHPVLTVERKEGRLTRVDEALSEGGSKESHIYLHFTRVDEERLAKIKHDVTEILRAVQAMVDDFALTLNILRNRMVGKGPAIFPPDAKEDWRREVRDFLQWMFDGNFIFMGYKRWKTPRAVDVKGEPDACGILGGNIGLAQFSKVLESEIERVTAPGRGRGESLYCAKTNVASLLHRTEELDLVIMREYGEGAEPVGGSVFAGLFTTRAAQERVGRIPLFRRKYAQALEALRFPPASHDRKAAEAILESLPKEEYYFGTPESLAELVRRVLEVESEGGTAVEIRQSEKALRYSPVLVMAKSNYSSQLQAQVRERLLDFFKTHAIREYTVWGEGELNRLHYYVTQPGCQPSKEEQSALQKELSALIESWDSQLFALLRKQQGDTQASLTLARLLPAFSAAYRSTPVAEVLGDIQHLEALEQTGQVQIGISDVHEGGRVTMTQLGIYTAKAIELSSIIPLMENMALNVNRQLPAELKFDDGRTVWVLKFWVRDEHDRPIAEAERKRALAEGIRQVLSGVVEDDPLNKLILEAKLDWWSASLFVTLRNYLGQALKLQREDVNRALIANPAPVRALFAYFEAKFSPADATPGAKRDLTGATKEFLNSLESVTSIAQDRILRRVFNVLQAGLRTNYYKVKGPDYYISLKIESGKVDDLPDPKPLYEVYVHAAGMEGIHLRGGKVARGGIRWSDRGDDFRTEILGLMKTQMVKNAVIVPVGSKGGFFVKHPPGDPRQAGAEAQRQYRWLISGLLDVTDNLVSGKVVHPEHVVVHDADDPYLVVAADKGTANFSDFANEIAHAYGFWLGDGFASGGSRGYNHKGMGITAKGAWECVKRHFREMGIDGMKHPFTVAGIGDMAGDVFGNGLLMSEAMRLVAAFNHAHIFLDPNPRPEAFAERQRLFNLPRSTWKDFNPAVISHGGGVFDRSAKVIPLSAEARKALGVEVAQVNGEELVRIILKAEVDLLWNGGIGTYVKATTELHDQVGDKVNDPVRIDAKDVRAKVIGEGGNLGVTARGRTEYDLKGGRLNTDAIDNSAGVDTSDHEVNLKIMTARLLEQKVLKGLEDRDQVLSKLEPEVERLVLEDNYWQSFVISLDRIRSKDDVAPFVDLITTLSREKGFNRTLERISTDTDLASFRTGGVGIPRPQLATLLSWAKMHAFDKLVPTPLMDDPYMRKYLVSYFPEEFAKKFDRHLDGHRLRREIIATVVTNLIVNQAGACFFDRMERETGATYERIARAYVFANDLLALDPLRAGIREHELSFRVPTDLTDQMYLSLESNLGKMVKNLLVNPPWPDLPLDQLEGFAKLVYGLKGRLTEAHTQGPAQDQAREEQRLVSLGVAPQLVHDILLLDYLRPSPYLITIAKRHKVRLEDAMKAHKFVGQRLGFDQLVAALETVPPTNPWEKQFNDKLYHRLGYHQGRLTQHVLRAREGKEPVEEAFARYVKLAPDVIAQIQRGLEQLKLLRPLTNSIPIFAFKELFRKLP